MGLFGSSSCLDYQPLINRTQRSVTQTFCVMRPFHQQIMAQITPPGAAPGRRRVSPGAALGGWAAQRQPPRWHTVPLLPLPRGRKHYLPPASSSSSLPWQPSHPSEPLPVGEGRSWGAPPVAPHTWARAGSQHPLLLCTDTEICPDRFLAPAAKWLKYSTDDRSLSKINELRARAKPAAGEI